VIHLAVFKTQRLVNDQYEDIYSLTLDKKDESNILKNVTMPVPLSSEIGIYLTSLINQVDEYRPELSVSDLDQAKIYKLLKINSEWANLEKSGWDSGQGFFLGISSEDVALLVGVFSLAKEASALGMELPKIISMANTAISFSTIWEMTELLLRYGEARASMASAFAARRKAVQDAETIEEVNLI
jgi:hypothetical protein